MFKRSISAALVGCLVLAACGGGDDDASTTSTTEAPVDEPAPETSTTAPPETTTTTTVPPLVVEGATVIVANASIVGGSAGRMSDALTAVGFTTASPTNATEKLDDSVVYYSESEGAQPVAESVARALGGVEAAPLPDVVPTESGDIAGGQVLLLLGDNQADQALEDPAAGGTSGDAATDAEGDGDTESTDAEADGESTDAESDATSESIENNGTTVVVANASGVSGSAGRMSDRLESAGFTLGTATNGVVQLADTVVHYTDAEGAQADAEAVAAALGGVEVEPMPDEVPVESGDFSGDVLVLLGTNQADQALDSLNP